jgi:predicted choloylglycine hydrolase
MCTTAAKKIDNSWFLIKTRDPVEWMRWDDEIKLFDTPDDKFKKLIVQNPDLHQDGYYGGINDQGVALVATYVHVAVNQISYIRRPYVRLILDAPTAKDAVEIIKSFNPRIGGNIFVADPKQCFGIEAVPEKYFIESVKESMVKTNHFLKLPNMDMDAPLGSFDDDWSKAHLKRAEKLLAQAKSVADLQNILKDRQNADKKMAICTTDAETKCYTHSAFVFDTKNKLAYYAQGNPAKVPFKKFGFA